MTIKTKKTICTTIALLLFLLTLGIVGGMEVGNIPLLKGFILSALCEVTGAFLLYKAGVVKL